MMQDDPISVGLLFTILLGGFSTIAVVLLDSFLIGYSVGIIAAALTLLAYARWMHQQGLTV